MDLGNLSEVLPIILVIIGIIAIQYFLRRKGGTKSSHQYVVHGLLSDIRINLRLVEILMDGEQIKRFSTNGWKLHSNNIEFLTQNLQSALEDVFGIAQDYNDQVATTKKFMTTNYEADINTARLKDLLQKCKSALEDWLMTNVGTTDPGGKTGIFDGLLGRR